MKPYDAIFLSVALGIFLERPRYWWLGALVPSVALAAHWLPLGPVATPVAAIAACLLVPRYAPLAIIMAIPVYNGPVDVTRATLLWLAVSVLMMRLDDQFDGDVLPSRTRRMAAQLLSVAVLYHTLLPVTFL